MCNSFLRLTTHSTQWADVFTKHILFHAPGTQSLILRCYYSAFCFFLQISFLHPLLFIIIIIIIIIITIIIIKNEWVRLLKSVLISSTTNKNNYRYDNKGNKFSHNIVSYNHALI